MKQVLRILLFCFSVGIFLSGCANIVSPTGGPEDASPPEILACEPPNESVLFFDRKVKILFDEYVQLNDLQGQLVISPPMPEEPNIFLKKRTLNIELSDSLAENTTYVINFGDAIQDLNENNKLKNYKYLFSTGSYLDSLRFHGGVVDARTQKAAAEYLVMLYPSQADSVPYKERPYYFSKTDNNGEFEIGYMKNGKYKAFVLLDMNGNYLYDLPEEQIGFLGSPVLPQNPGDIVPEKLQVFQENTARQFIKSQKYSSPGALLLVMNKPSENLKVAFPEPSISAKIISEFSSDNDSCAFWFSGDAPKSVTLVVTDDNYADTTTIDLDDPSAADSTLKLKCNNTEIELNKQLNFKSPVPLKNIDTSKMELLIDSVATKFILQRQAGLERRFSVDVAWKESSNYTFRLLPGAVTSIFNQQHDTLNFSFTTKKEDDYGKLSLNLKLSGEGSPYILEMLDESSKVVDVRVLQSSSIEKFDYLIPKKYSFRLIHDGNGNGKWDTGNYLQGLQPEKVVVMPEQAEIRANWELDLEWTPN